MFAFCSELIDTVTSAHSSIILTPHEITKSLYTTSSRNNITSICSNIRNMILFIGSGIIGVIGSDCSSDCNDRDINEDEIDGRNIIDVSLLWE